MILNAEIEAYFEEIELSKTVRARIGVLAAIAKFMLPEGAEIEGSVVSELVAEDKTRTYESVWFYTDDHLVEAHNMMTEDTVDVCVYKNSIFHYQIKSVKWSPDTTPSADSRLVLDFIVGSARGTAKGSGSNCAFISKFMQHCLIPNLVPATPRSGPSSVDVQITLPKGARRAK